MTKKLDAEEMTKRLNQLNMQLDKIATPYIAEIRNIINSTYFADIESEQQQLDNLGNVYYHDNPKDHFGKKFKDISLDYIIYPKQLGVFYGSIYEKKDKNGTATTHCKAYPFDNYSRFIADVLSRRVLFSRELGHFIFKDGLRYSIVANENDFYNYYTMNKNRVIRGFLDIFEELFQSYLNQDHGYTIEPYKIAGTDWIIDIETNEIKQEAPMKKHLYFDYYEVPLNDIQPTVAKEYIEMVGGTPNSIHNTMLLHAYVMKRKMHLISPEQWFLFKDFGRTGKGLFFTTFNKVFKVHKIEFGNLIAGAFEAQNEMRNLYGADLAHANETGAINEKQMRFIRKIATGETVTARRIGGDNFTFKVDSVFALDTNEDADIGDMLSNTSRTVMIAFQDRPPKETSKQRHAIFAPYWKFIVDNHGETKLSASLSFLINSIQYLESCGGVFDFEEVTLKHYYSVDQLTDSQLIALVAISELGYVLANDETLQSAIAEDYGSMRFKTARDDFAKIGVANNQAKYIDGKTYKVFAIEDEMLFKEACKLLEEFQNDSKTIKA